MMNLKLAIYTCQTGNYVTNSTVLVSDILHVEGVARFAVSPTKVCVFCAVWSLNLHDEPMNEQNDVVQVAVGWVHQVLL